MGGDGMTQRHTARGNIQPLLIAGIPADDDRNRDHARRLHFHVDLPVPPPGSAPATCAACNSAMWIDPESQKLRAHVSAAGYQPALICLTCASLLTRSGEATPVHPSDTEVQQFKRGLGA